MAQALRLGVAEVARTAVPEDGVALVASCATDADAGEKRRIERLSHPHCRGIGRTLAIETGRGNIAHLQESVAARDERGDIVGGRV